MIKFVGDINIFLDSLGKKQGDSSILKSISIIAIDFDVEYFNYDDVRHTYFHFFKRGVDFVFSRNDNMDFLESIFFYIKKCDEYYPYPFLGNLFDGIGYKVNKNDLIFRFGEPELYSDSWIRYNVNDKYIHFEFDDYQELSQITLFINV